MDIKNAIDVLKESQGGHLYDIYVPSLDKEISFKPLKVGQLKTLNKFSIEDEDNFYKALSSLIVELSEGQIELNKINEIDRALILSEIKKNNTTSPESIKIVCGECEKEFSHDLDIDNYDDDECLKEKVQDFQTKIKLGDDLTIKITIGLATVQEQIEFKSYVINQKKKQLSAAKKKARSMVGISDADKREYVTSEVENLERHLLTNSNWLFLRGLKIGDQDVEILGSSPEQRMKLFDQLPANVKGEIVNGISKEYKNTLEHFMKYNVTCPHCSAEHVEEVSISNFFTI